jgi:hypothetical protein
VSRAVKAPKPAARPAALLLTYQDAARACGCGVSAIRRAVKLGELQIVNAPGTTGDKGRRVTAASMKAYVERQLKGGRA